MRELFSIQIVLTSSTNQRNLTRSEFLTLRVPPSIPDLVRVHTGLAANLDASYG